MKGMLVGIFAMMLIVESFSTTIRDECEMIEVNHHHDAAGNLVFVQVIFWNWDDYDNTYVVRDWRFLDDSTQIYEGAKLAVFRVNSTRYMIKARDYRETWTQVIDPEVENKKHWPEGNRMKLKLR